MSDIVQPAIETTRRGRIRNVAINEDDLLVLAGNDPRTVFVRAASLNGKTIAEFSLDSDPDGAWFTGGLSWKGGHEHALFITFSFQPSTIDVLPVGVDTDLPSSPPYGTNLSSQDMCVPPVFHANVIYDFIVKFNNGHKHDPKMVVSPINN